MKPKNNVSYFPVEAAEQALLLRVREPDLAGRTAELLAMVDQLAEANLVPADLEQAIQLLVESRQGDGLDARFDNLEGRLKGRIEKALAEIEGRLSKRLSPDAPASDAPAPVPASDALAVDTPAPVPASPAPTAATTLVQPTALDRDVPKEASVAFRIGSELVWGTSASQFYVAVWRWLFEHGHVTIGDLPIQSGRVRFVVAAEPVHPTGRAFTRSEEVVPGSFVELNLSRGDIVRRAKKYLGQHGVAFEVVVGSEG